MPHLIIECSENVLTAKKPEEVIQAVYNTVVSTETFANNVMVRINPYKYYTTMGSTDDFIYVFANILDGRTTEQKKLLSDNVVRMLKNMFPDVPKISMNIREFEKATFTNNAMV
jgi:5-carboxymethyl-2-hydroxymuconate isomerase